MSRKILLFIAVLALLLSGFAGQQDEVLKKAVAKAREAITQAKTAEERADIARELLQKYPEIPNTADALQLVIQYQFHEKGDLDGTIAYVKEIYAKLKDPQIMTATRDLLLDLYANPDYGKELEALAEEIMKSPMVKFTDHLSIIRSGVKVENWDLVLKHAEAARPFAGPEAFRKQYADRNFSEKTIQVSGKNRQGLLDSYKGWALANKKMHSQAIAAFEVAKETIRFTYLGVPDNELYLFWGKTLMMTGDHGGAIKKLAPPALFGSDEDAIKALESAYSAQNGNGNGFDQYLEKIRAEIAPQMSDFTAVNYDDKKQTYESLKGKVTLVAFWFPT